jgi:hypothetical protein
VFDLYEEYCHGRMDRREFLAKSEAVNRRRPLPWCSRCCRAITGRR